MTKTTVTQSPKADVYTRVTEHILADLEKGVRPWMKPWSAPQDDRMPLLPLRANGCHRPPYRSQSVIGM